jgi:hypothetical protein
MRGALQVPAGGVSLRAADRRREPPRGGSSASSSWPTPACSTSALLRRDRRVREGRARRRLHPHHGRQPRAGGARAARAAAAVVPQHVEWGDAYDEGATRKPRICRKARHGPCADHADARHVPASRRTGAGWHDRPPLLFTENETNNERCSESRTLAVREGRVPRVRRPRPSGRGQPGAKSAPRRARITLDARARANRRYRCACASAPRDERSPVRPGFDTVVNRARSDEADDSSIARARRRPSAQPTSARCSARPTPGCSGRSSSTTTSCALARRRPAAAAAAPAAQAGRNADWGTSSTATSSRCPTSGSTRGTPRGTSPST